MPTAHAIDVMSLTKTFGSFRALDDVDLHVAHGEIHGFLGPNGAGKSTTIRTLLGLLRPDAGAVRVLGRDPWADPAGVTRRTSYVPGDVTLWGNLTGQEVLDALAGMRGAYDAAAERALIEAFALDPSRRIRTYSKGNRQKVALVAAFAARTEVLILDEPTSGLDPLMEEVFQECVRAAADQGRTVLLSSHILAEVEKLCAAATIIKAGQIVESGPIDAMRHLHASRVTALLPTGERVDRAVEPGDIPAELAALLAAEATEITCTPATLEDLFLRHYETVAR